MAFDILPAAFPPGPAAIAGIGAPLYLAASLLTYIAFAEDKRRAILGEWRLREATLLWLALLGGWPGAKLAQRRLRHKTRKQPFASSLNAIAIGHVAVIALLAATPAGDRLVAGIRETGAALSAAAPAPEPEPAPPPRVWSLQ